MTRKGFTAAVLLLLAGLPAAAAPLPDQRPDLTTTARPPAQPLEWPAALRGLVPAKEVGRLRARIEDHLAEIEWQRTGRGRVDNALANEAKAQVEELKRLLRKEAPELPVQQYIEARRFLELLKARADGGKPFPGGEELAPK